MKHVSSAPTFTTVRWHASYEFTATSCTSQAFTPGNFVCQQTDQQQNENTCKGLKRSPWFFTGNLSLSYGASPAIWDHTVLPATWQRQTHQAAHALTSARKVGTWLTYPRGRDRRLSWTWWSVIYLDALPVCWQNDPTESETHNLSIASPTRCCFAT